MKGKNKRWDLIMILATILMLIGVNFYYKNFILDSSNTEHSYESDLIYAGTSYGVSSGKDTDKAIITKKEKGKLVSQVEVDYNYDNEYIMRLEEGYEDHAILSTTNRLIIVNFSTKQADIFKSLGIRYLKDGICRYIDYATHEEKQINWTDEVITPEVIRENVYMDYYRTYEVDNEMFNLPYDSSSWEAIYEIEKDKKYLFYDKENKKIYLVTKNENSLVAEDVNCFGEVYNDDPKERCLLWIDSNGKLYKNFYLKDNENVLVGENALGIDILDHVLYEDKIVSGEEIVNS